MENLVLDSAYYKEIAHKCVNLCANSSADKIFYAFLSVSVISRTTRKSLSLSNVCRV